MYQLSGERTASYGRERNEKLPPAQTMWNQLSVSGYVGKYFPAFYFCTGSILLDASVWTPSHGADRGRCVF